MQKLDVKVRNLVDYETIFPIHYFPSYEHAIYSITLDKILPEQHQNQIRKYLHHVHRAHRCCHFKILYLKFVNIRLKCRISLQPDL